MADAEYTGDAPSCATETPTTETDITADIAKALYRARNALEDVKDGVRAFLGFAAYNDSDFARDAHYVIRKVDDDLGHAVDALNTVAAARRLGDRERNRADAIDTEAAVDRLKAAVAQAGPETLEAGKMHQQMINGALSDAVLMLLYSTYGNHWDAITEAFGRMGYRLERSAET